MSLDVDHPNVSFVPSPRFLLVAALAMSVLQDASAQAAFTRPIRIVVPVTAGATTDVIARLVAEGIRESIGQPVFVENRPGATGRIAADALKRAAPDGTTLLVAPMVVSVLGPLVFRDLGYDPSRDFAPVAQISRYSLAMAVRADHPARTVPEFVAWARANAQRASYGTGGSGSLPHLLGVLVGRAADVAMIHVAYRNLGQVEAELLSGQIAAGITALGDVLSLESAGRLRIIATSGIERSTRVPEVPTFVEQGFPSVIASGWNAVYAPAGTPKAMLDQLSAAIASTLRTPAVRAKLTSLGVEPTGTTPDELTAIIAADIAHWTPIVKAAGFAPEAR